MRIKLTHSHLKRAISDQMRFEADGPTTLADEHDLVRHICDELERVADALPDMPTASVIGTLVLALRVGIPAHCTEEERAFRTWLGTGPEPSGPHRRALERLTSEHSENEPLGHELAEALETVQAEGRIRNPDALGYLIRLYFHTMRRHVEWEEYILTQVLDRP
ncbi:hemerythrin domain-containing protein [Minwuia sp.]|uniref:hemerythrin domain-containing protein n=1 Tax=Minwuia sp. TaxID=2493630 RepID=UPI003A94E065